MSINTIVLSGRAGKDPEVRYFESGSAVASLSIAVDRFKKEDGPDWFDVELWGKLAQSAADYVRKGSRIAVTGRLEQQKWTDRTTGERRSKVLVRAGSLELLDTKDESEQRQQRQLAAAQGAAPGSQPPAWNTSAAAPSDEDVPF